MRILVADTSSSVCITGVFEDDKLIAENCLDNGKTHSENFMPLIKQSLEDAKLGLSDIDVIGVVIGPGSFTGIRIGIASCKAMAEVIGIKVVPIVSLESLAGNEIGNSEIICSMIDARNNQVYCGIFDGNVECKEELMADDINVILEKVSKYDNIVLVGDGVILHKDLIEEKMNGKNIKFSENNKQDVASLGIVTYKKACKSEFLTADEVVPMYLRKSQAERMKNESKDC